MIQKLKVDFHVHTGEDPKDRYIRYSAQELLDKAVEYNFDAITIANHGTVLYNKKLREYAEKRGIVLIPGMEAYVGKKHILIVNCQQRDYPSLNFKNLRSSIGKDALIIAPHPFYPRDYCLREKLEEHIEVFDAIEYSHMYFRLINFNKKAVAIAKKYALPLVGNSDAHALKQLHTTYSLVDAEKSIPAIIEAVREKRVQVVTRPLSTAKLLQHGSRAVFSLSKKFICRKLRTLTRSSESLE